MSDAAFKTAPYPAYTTQDLLEFIAYESTPTDRRKAMCDEVGRRFKVAYGDISVMTQGERLRHVRKQEA